MRFATMICGLAAVILAVPAFAQDMPHRKPGLWESTMSSAQMAGRNVVSQQCIDEKTDADMLKRVTSANDGDQKTNCSQRTSKRTSTGFEFDSVCKHGDGTLSSHMVMAGDFNNQYTMDIKSHREPAPKSGSADTQTRIDARHVGACPADMKPGDMKVNGMLMRADGMPANLSAKQAEQMKQMMEQMRKQMQK